MTKGYRNNKLCKNREALNIPAKLTKQIMGYSDKDFRKQMKLQKQREPIVQKIVDGFLVVLKLAVFVPFGHFFFFQQSKLD